MRLFRAPKGKPALLIAEDILEQAYCQVVRQRGVDTIVFEKPVHVVIADDSDDHRSRTGFMSYEEAHLLRFGGKVWGIGLGTKTGSYPGSRYARDIVAVDASGVAESELPEVLGEKLREGHHPVLRDQCRFEPFYNTLAVAMRDGELIGAHDWFSRFGPKYDSSFKVILEELTAWETEESSISSTTHASARRKRRLQGYKPEVVDALVAFICETLATA